MNSGADPSTEATVMRSKSENYAATPVSNSGSPSQNSEEKKQVTQHFVLVLSPVEFGDENAFFGTLLKNFVPPQLKTTALVDAFPQLPHTGCTWGDKQQWCDTLTGRDCLHPETKQACCDSCR